MKCFALSVLILLCIINNSFAQGTFNSNAAAGNWNAAGSWTLTGGADADGIPDANDAVTILNTHSPRINVNCAASSITINNGGQINFNTNSVTLAVGGNFTMIGTGNTTGSNATRILTIGGNLIVNAGATSSFSGIDITVTGTSSINGALDFSATTGGKIFTGDMTIGAAGSLGFSSTEQIDLSGNLVMVVGSSINGAATGIVNVAGNLTINAGGTSSIGRVDLNVTGTTTINGTLSLFSSTTGVKTLTGNVTFNNGSALSYGVSETLDLTNNLTFNGAVTVSGATTGLMNVGGTYTVSAGATLTLSDQSLTVTGTTNINGTIAYTNNQGTKTFTGLITIAGTGNWNCSAVDEQFTINGGITNSGTFLASLSTAAASDYTFAASGTLTGTLSMPNVTVSGAGTTVTNNGTVTVSTALAGSGTWLQAANRTLNIGAGTITAVLNATANGNTINYNSGAQNVYSTTYCHLSTSVSGVKTLAGTITVTGNINVQGTTVLDAGANRDINLAGNWTVTSTAANPFVEQQGTVTLNGSAGTQAISTSVAAGETFYDMVINNTSVTIPGINTVQNINISHTYTHTTGKLDLLGKSLIITGSAATTTDNFTAGSIYTSIAGANITITDPSDNTRVNFYGTAIGDVTNGVTTTCTSNDSYFTNTILYGTANFTKTGNGTNDTQGGNIFYGPVTFTTTATADRWRMANTNPDIFYNATFNHNGASNFIVARQTMGNEFYGTTTFTSTSAGGMYVSRGNTGADASAVFHGPVIFNVTLTGNMTVSEGGAGRINTSTFESTITLNSTATSTGDINFGAANNNNSITVAAGGSFVAGAINGQTNVRLYNVTQVGATAQVLNTAGSTGTLYVGGVTSLTSAYPCSFGGNCTFSADTSGYISSATFSGNLIFSVTNGNGYLQSSNVGGNLTMNAGVLRFRNTTITGTSAITQTGTINSTSNGGNIFNGNTTITNSGTGQLRCASSGSDDFNANATYVQTNTGILSPVYSNPVTYAGNISTVGSTSVITFGTTGTNAAITDGSGTQSIDGPAGFIPLFNYLQTNHTGTVQLNKNFSVVFTLTMSQGNVNLNGNTLTLGTGATSGTAGTLAYTAGWLYGGTFKRWQYANSYAITNVRGLFPMGTSTVDYRPLWIAYTVNLTAGGTVSVVHTPVYPSTYIVASHNDASWGNTLQGVSNSSWTVSTASGFAFNGATGQIRFGGTGFGTNVLADLDASLTASVVATFSAATNVAVPYEVTRTAVSTANLGNLWRIGTRNVLASGLPITLISFTAQVESDKVHVNWLTESEINNDFFTVERSEDGINFTGIENTPGAGTTNIEHAYEAFDLSPLNGTSYYRLKQTDFDGNFTYSDIVAVYFGNEANVMVYPNPANASIFIQLNEMINENVIISITNVYGQIVFNKNFAIDKTAQTLSFNNLNLSQGTYVVNVFCKP